MEYPIFDLPIVHGSMLIAAMGILHVYLAQFSIGGAFLMAWAERKAIRANDTDSLQFLRKYAFLILVLPYVVGTASGAGIWFVISVISPRLTSAMIHQFVWAWAAEWALFAVEVPLIYLYFYSWDHVSRRFHNRIAWIFAFATWGTLLFINGIISFMLTTGTWEPWGPGNFWKAFFNPIFFPTTAIRTLMSLAFAGAFLMLLLAIVRDVKDRVRENFSRMAYRLMLPAAVCFPLGVWAFVVLPPVGKLLMWGAGPLMIVFTSFGATISTILIITVVLAMMRKDYTASLFKGSMLVLFALVAYGSLEFVREGVRKPFTITDFMYSTGVTTDKAARFDRRASFGRLRQAGALSAAPYALPPGKAPADLDPAAKGRAVYMATCQACHSIDGYLTVRAYTTGWSAVSIRHLIDHMNEMKPMMPPFPGTDDERDALIAYILSLHEEHK